MATLVSFDIDGTLEIGEPPGLLTVGAVRAARGLGYLVGTCSDRPVAHQRELWARLGLIPDFTVLKHRLAAPGAEAYVTIAFDDHWSTI